jgi:hypothetical protein
MKWELKADMCFPRFIFPTLGWDQSNHPITLSHLLRIINTFPFMVEWKTRINMSFRRQGSGHQSQHYPHTLLVPKVLRSVLCYNFQARSQQWCSHTRSSDTSYSKPSQARALLLALMTQLPANSSTHVSSVICKLDYENNAEFAYHWWLRISRHPTLPH